MSECTACGMPYARCDWEQCPRRAGGETMTTRRCVDCAYSHANTETIVLECRRYPPVIAGLEAVWVQVDTDDWCGEWRAG